MILEEFEKILAIKWGELLIPHSKEAENRPVTHPVALAFVSLEHNNEEIHDGEVIMTQGVEQHWQVLEKEYSISRKDAEVLMILARHYPSVFNAPREEQQQIMFREFYDGLDELTKAGVLDKTEKDDHIEYELSHDLLSSVIFKENFAELWKKTRELRAVKPL